MKQRTIGLIIAALFAIFSTLVTPSLSDAAATSYRVYEYFEGLPDDYKGKNNDWEGSNFNSTYPEASDYYSMGAKDITTDGKTYTCVGWKDGIGTNVPASGSARSLQFALKSDVAITWIYKEAHILTIRSKATTGSGTNAIWGAGHNNSGQLGNGTTTTDYTMKKILERTTSAPDDYTVLSVGVDNHVAAIKADGTLWTWGKNNDGKLGDDTTTDHKTPVHVFTDYHFTDVAAGSDTTAVIRNDGTLWTWGKGKQGQLGNGEKPESSHTAEQVGKLHEWRSVTAGQDYFMAIQNNGSLWAWGENNYGRLGYSVDGDDNQPTPKRVGKATDKWRMVAAGSAHSAGIKEDGSLWLWGWNHKGQVGNRTKADVDVPEQVMLGSRWKSVAPGFSHTLAVREDGTLWAWGENADYRQATDSTDDVTFPRQIGDASNWRTVAAGRKASMAIKEDGSLYAWGTGPFDLQHKSAEVIYKTPTKIGTEKDWLKLSLARNEGDLETIMAIRSTNRIEATPHLGTRTLVAGESYAITAKVLPTDGSASYYLSSYTDGSGNISPATGTSYQIPLTLTKNSSVTWSNAPPGASHSVTVNFIDGVPEAVMNSAAFLPSKGTLSIPDGNFTFSAPLTVDVDGSLWEYDGWSSGTGDVPSTGSTNSFTVKLSKASSIMWKYKKRADNAVSFSFSAAGEVPYSQAGFKLSKQVNGNWQLVSDETNGNAPKTFSFDQDTPIKLTAKATVTISGIIYTCTGISIQSPNYKAPVTTTLNGDTKEFTLTLNDTANTKKSWSLQVNIIYEVATRVELGHAVTLPQGCVAGLPALYDRVTLERPGNQSDTKDNAFHWTDGKFYPVRPVTLFKVLCDNNIVKNYFAEWGTIGQEKVVVATPLNLNPTSGYKLEQIHYSESYDYGTWPTKLDEPIQPLKAGKTLLRFSDAAGSPKFLAFNVVAATPETSAATCTIGNAIPPPSGQAHRTPYIYYEKAHYDAAVYDRSTRSGDIIPVNTNVAKLPEQDMVVAWYAAGNAESATASKIYWPLTGNLIKYDCQWPATATEIVVPGPGLTLSDEQKTGNIYNQPDSTLPGYNPNEEHAFLQGGRIHALRTDLNNANTSESWVLLKYKATNTQKWHIQPYKVKNTGLLEYAVTAGTLIQPPSPLNLLPLTDASRHKAGDSAGNEWYFKDHKGGHWAKAAKSDSNQSKIVMQWFYPLQTGFYYPSNFTDGTGAPVKVGDPVPFQNGGEIHSDPPKSITYKVSWPETAPVLNIGETLTVAKKGLPAVSAMAAVKKIFDEGETKTPVTTLAQLFAPYSERFIALDSLPADINKEDKGSFIEFTDLPYVLRSRLSYDATARKLMFKGISVDSVTGEPLLLSNIMSEKERDRIKSIAKGAPWADKVDALYNQARTPLYPTVSGVQQALSAGNAGSSGYMVLAENDDEALGAAPVALHVLKVEGGPYRGEIKVIKSDNPFDEKLTLRHSGDFAGVTDNIYYSWYYQPDNGGNQPLLPVTGDMAGWVQFKTGKGLNDITIEGAGKLTLEDNWFIVRYYYGDDPKTTAVFDPVYPSLVNNDAIKPSGATDISLITNYWSPWAGAPGGETAQLAEGWIKRVVSDLNPLDARVADFRNNETSTTVSMISQAGQRYNGAIALNGSADNINNIGLIEAYQTVLDRGESLSIKSSPPVDSSATNTALLNAATRIADFYTMLGNEAYRDSEDPTVSFDSHSGQAGAMASSIFAFQNQVDSLLEEELTLLRGRDNTTSTTQAAPFYNRLIWNFTNGDGELAYVQTYNIGDRNIDGFINEADAKIMYPQGHGDAWGHYLTAMTTWYGLLRNPDYTWVPRSESVMVGGSPVPVDYLDERKFARTAAYKAHTGAETVDFTYRKLYVEDPAGQYQGYKDNQMVTQNGAQVPRAWGLDDWARRAGQGAYFDWVTANALIPAEDKVNVGIKKIDRTTLPELNQIIGHFIRMQFRADQSDVGYNPLGLARGVVPFDIDPNLLVSIAGREPQGHFEQIYGRAVKALENAGTAFDYAAQYSEMLRKNEDTLDTFKKQLIDMEWDYKNQLIELFGYPYSGDIGSGKTYPSGYDGPDLFHYNYMDVPKLTGLEEQSNTITYKATFKLDKNDSIKFEDDGLEMKTQTLDVSYPVSPDMPWKFDIPSGWGERRAPGEIQMALQELIRTNASYKQSLSTYAVALKEIESAAKLLEAVYDIKKVQVIAKEDAEDLVIYYESLILAAKEVKLILESYIKLFKDEAEAALEGIPKIVGTAIDPAFALRLVGNEAKAHTSFIMEQSANWLEFSNNGLEFIVRRLETATELKVFINDARVEVQNLAVELQRKAESILPMIPDMYAQQAAMQESLNRYKAALAKGLVLLDSREYDRTVASGDITEYRYQDFAFRTFRNDAVQKYRTTFNLASRYAYLAATAYDYETNLLRSDTDSGANVMASIFKQLSPGVINNGVPLAGGGGLADALAQLNQNFGVYKTQLGFNNPQTETTPFSLRSGLFRIRPDASSTASWQEELSKYKVANLNDYPSFNRYCRPFAENSNVAQPGLVIPFSTEVRFGKNFFGFPLGSGDSSYDPSRFATKIRSVGLWFKGYKNAGLANTPRAYLVPVGTDVLRSPSGNSFEERHWQVVDQKLPVPFPMTASEIADASFIPIHNTLSDVLGGIRKFSSIRGYDDDQSIDGLSAAKLAQMNTDSGLVGRSVWNNQWLLIIPGGYLLNDPAAGLDNFINNVSDIRLYFQTYSYSGN